MNTKPIQRGRARAFTLIELLVVIAVIAILAAMLLPALAKSKKLSQESYCKNNMKQIALAVGVYAVDNHERLPLITDFGRAWFLPEGKTKTFPWRSPATIMLVTPPFTFLMLFSLIRERMSMPPTGLPRPN